MAIPALAYAPDFIGCEIAFVTETKILLDQNNFNQTFTALGTSGFDADGETIAAF